MAELAREDDEEDADGDGALYAEGVEDAVCLDPPNTGPVVVVFLTAGDAG